MDIQTMQFLIQLSQLNNTHKQEIIRLIEGLCSPDSIDEMFVQG